jgi:hypothetical protein
VSAVLRCCRSSFVGDLSSWNARHLGRLLAPPAIDKNDRRLASRYDPRGTENVSACALARPFPRSLPAAEPRLTKESKRARWDYVLLLLVLSLIPWRFAAAGPAGGDRERERRRFGCG